MNTKAKLKFLSFSDLFKVRDAADILAKFDFATFKFVSEVNAEVQKRLNTEEHL